MTEAILVGVIGAISSAFFGWLAQPAFHRRIVRQLNQRLDALVGTALKLAMRGQSGMEGRPVPFREVADRLLATGLVTSEGHAELMELWEARHHLLRTRKLIETLGEGAPS